MVTCLRCGGRSLDLTRPHVMGVLNVTPDSFSDGGRFWRDGKLSLDAVTRVAARMVRDGASIIDVGGESTRPGATAVPAEEEIDRVLPVVHALTSRLDAVVSVDTSSPELMRASASAGAGLINDVRALQRPGALVAAAESGLAVCLMHMQGEPAGMQHAPHYGADVTSDVLDFLLRRVEASRNAGIAEDRLLIDPGFGFGKNLQHNLTLFRDLRRLVATGIPVMVGVSRKSMIGQVLGRPVNRRLAGGLALAALAVEHGVGIVRTHDVGATHDVLRMCAAVRESGRS